MKGQIPIIEMVTVVVILFVTFGIFFPQISVENRWEDANVILKGRDIVLTMDRAGLMGGLVSSPSEMEGFLNRNLPDRNLISWTTLDGTVQSEVTVACNCTTQQIDDLLNAMGRLKLNERNVTIDFIASTLSPIQQSDALLIFGETDLSPYRDDIISYLRSGKGVVGLADVTDPDATYTEIFGVDDCSSVLGSCSGEGGSELEFVVPSSVSLPSFQPYKLFHHLPMRSLNTGIFSAEVPVEGGISTCPIWPVPDGFFSFKSVDVRYWMCFQDDTVYLDTNSNNIADTIVSERGTFTAGGSSFVMSYAQMNSTFGRIFVSIKPEFAFDDFRPADVDLFPADLDQTKILLRDGSYGGGNDIPVVTVNKSTPGLAVWAPESLATGEFNHDERLLLASVILAASDKDAKDPFVGDFQIGFLTPYINVNARDMFEVYQFNLGLGFPF